MVSWFTITTNKKRINNNETEQILTIDNLEIGNEFTEWLRISVMITLNPTEQEFFLNINIMDKKYSPTSHCVKYTSNCNFLVKFFE